MNSFRNLTTDLFFQRIYLHTAQYVKPVEDWKSSKSQVYNIITKYFEKLFYYLFILNNNRNVKVRYGIQGRSLFIAWEPKTLTIYA
jgi:hypothetical protein